MMATWYKCIRCRDVYTQQKGLTCPKCGDGMPAGVPLDYVIELNKIKKEIPHDIYIIVSRQELEKRINYRQIQSKLLGNCLNGDNEQTITIKKTASIGRTESMLMLHEIFYSGVMNISDIKKDFGW